MSARCLRWLGRALLDARIDVGCHYWELECGREEFENGFGGGGRRGLVRVQLDDIVVADEELTLFLNNFNYYIGQIVT